MSLPPINNSLVSYGSSAQRYIKLLEEHTELKIKHENTKKELEKLEKENQENTIISSMNDMKKSYEIQEKKIEKLKECISEIYDYIRTAKAMITVVSTNVSDYTNMRTFKYELRTRLEFVIEMLESSLKKKSELLYLEYDL
jgi:prophage DNA circulation protein